MCGATCQCPCNPSGAEAGNCSDMVDNDCDGLIDCSDPNCGPTRCAGGTENGEECSTDVGIMACTAGGGVCQCPAIKKDPTTIRFGRPGASLDRFVSHGRFLIPGAVDIMGTECGFLLSNNQGRIYGATLPPGALTSNTSGTAFRYRDLNARTRGGVSRVRLRITHGNTYRYWVEAYGDLSAAVDANMAIQVYLGNQPTSAIHAEAWMRTSFGWKATGFESAERSGQLP